MKKNISKVLIANRSEIALRIQTTCHDQEIQTVAIFSPEDRYTSFVYRATQAYPLSLSGYAAYFAQDEIIAIAHQAEADAIHPGYGFLSENASFAQKVIDAGLTWIGPSPLCIATMASKIESRKLMEQAGAPVVPGFIINDLSEHGCVIAKLKANKIGYPLIIKDPKSGGGKAMRRVDNEQGFQPALAAVTAEASRLTGSTELLVEKYIEQGRHIEIQVAGDGKNFIHLYERECSIQRRHQKIIEETPCNFVDSNVLQQMYQAALCAAQKVNYDNIGTIEFIVTPSQQFYFLEMNTRLQVEHAVTEITTGVDLVSLQLHIASTGKLPLQQHDIVRHGHALQCRLYAEDADQNFIPSTGIIHHLSLPKHPFVRCEIDVEQGYRVTPFFDPMIARFIAFGATRAQSIARMKTFLHELCLEGVITNRDFLFKILSSGRFITGDIHTQLLTDSTFMQSIKQTSVQSDIATIADYTAGIAAYLVEHERRKINHSDKQNEMTSQTKARRVWKDIQR